MLNLCAFLAGTMVAYVMAQGSNLSEFLAATSLNQFQLIGVIQMSHLDNAHKVTSYTSGVTVALTGQRLATICYKGKTVTNKDGSKTEIPALPNRAVSLPVISDMQINNAINRLMPHVKAMLYKAQDGIIREMLGNTVASNAALELVSDVDISIDSCLAWMEADGESGRMTKDGLNSWFDTALADSLMIALAGKLGASDVPTDAELVKIAALMDSYKSKIAALAGGKTAYTAKEATALLKALDLVVSDDESVIAVHTKLVARLKPMSVKEELEDLL